MPTTVEIFAELRRQFARKHPDWFDLAQYAEASPRELARAEREKERIEAMLARAGKAGGKK